jgi:hypothetical protein
LQSGPGAVVFGDASAVDTTASFAVAGDYTLALRAEDGELTGVDTVQIGVLPEPDTEPPSVSLTTPEEGDTVAGLQTIAATASDDSAVAAVSFLVDGGLLGVVTEAPYEVSWDTTAVGNGPHTVTATAADTSGNETSATVNVTVDNGVPVNAPPSVDAGTAQTIRLPVDTVSLDGTVTDDGLPTGTLTTLWSFESGPGAVVFGDASAVDTTASFTAAGAYTLSLTGDDGGLMATDTVLVTVEAAPVLSTVLVTPAMVSLVPDETATFSAAGEDQYGDPIAVSPVWTASGGSIDAGGTYTAGAVAGDFTVTATDGGIEGQADVEITVPAGSAPRQDYLQFDGADDVFSVLDDATLDIAAAITLEAWIKPDTLANSKSQDRVVTKGSNYEMTVSTGDTGCIGDGDVQWRASVAGSDQRICGGFLTLGEWHHVAGVYNGSAMVLYVDGIEVARLARSGAMATNNEVLRIGNRGTIDRPFDGAIDEVRIWNRALTPAELDANREVELTVPQPGLVAYYKLNEGTGQIGADTTANANDGALGFTLNVENSDPAWTSE